MADEEVTNGRPPQFDFDAYPEDTCFHERRSPQSPSGEAKAPKARKERRRRVDPTTFEKQYSEQELEFMNAMQRYKMQNCKAFPSYREVLEVARSLGYRRQPKPDAES